MRKAFECREDYIAAMKALKDFTEGKSAGYLLTYADAERLTGFPRDTHEFNYLVRIRFAREMLRHRRIVLQAIPTIGYRFMSPDEVLEDRVPLRIRKSRNQMRKGENEVLTVTEDLNKIKNTAKRRLAISAHEYLMEKRKEINRALRHMRKTETLPVRKPM